MINELVKGFGCPKWITRNRTATQFALAVGHYEQLVALVVICYFDIVVDLVSELGVVSYVLFSRC